MPQVLRTNPPSRKILRLVCGLGLLATAGPLALHAQIPLANVIAEAEQNISAKRYAQAAQLLELALGRAEKGEPLAGGISLERLRLATATALFQSQAYAKAAEVAQRLVASRPSQGPLNEGRLILGLSLALDKKFDEAIPVFAALEESTTYRDKALLYRAMAAQQAGKIDVAIDAYSRLLATARRDADWADAAITLTALHVQQKNLAEARKGLTVLRANLGLVDNLAGLNVLGLQLGDVFVTAGDPAGALAAYRTVSRKDELVRAQTLKNQQMEAQITRAKTVSRGTPAELDALRRIEARLAAAKTALEEIEKLPSYDATLLYRLGNAFLERGSVWEAALVFDKLITEHPGSPERERAFLGLVRAYSEAGRFEKTRDVAKRFLEAYPKSDFGAQAMYLAALAAEKRKDVTAQLEFLTAGAERYANSELGESLGIMQANALFAAGRYEEVRQKSEAYAKDHPQGKFAEEAAYLSTMAGLVLGENKRAIGEIDAYLKKFPEGRFVPDARYRLAAANYGLQEFAKCADLVDLWLKTFPADHPQRGEVLSLQGDAFAGLERIDEAVASYRAALELTLSDEQLGYVLDELTKIYQSRGEFDAAVAMWDAFARERPEHPFVINAAYWIGRIRARENRVPEALAQVGDIARRYLADPTRGDVDRLLTEIAGMIAKPAKVKAGQPKPAPLTDDAVAQEIDRLLLDGQTKDSATARARSLFTQAEAAALRKNEPLRDKLYERIGAEFAPADLPPGILGKVGDHLFAKGDYVKATSFYQQIVAAHGKSIFADFGYTGLGQLALSQGRADDAFAFFNAAIDKAGARFKLREATLGRARSLLALGKLDDAKELFEQVAANRQWRGEATAESVFSLGEILAKRGGNENLAQAQAHYQRVFISYRKFTPWVARAYLRSAQTFEQLGQITEAVATLREMGRDNRLAAFPEAKTGAALLQKLEPRVPATPPAAGAATGGKS